MGVLHRPIDVVVLRDLTGKLIQETAAICDAWEDDGLLLDSRKQPTNCCRTIDRPFRQNPVLVGLVFGRRVDDREQSERPP